MRPELRSLPRLEYAGTATAAAAVIGGVRVGVNVDIYRGRRDRQRYLHAVG